MHAPVILQVAPSLTNLFSSSSGPGNHLYIFVVAWCGKRECLPRFAQWEWFPHCSWHPNQEPPTPPQGI